MAEGDIGAVVDTLTFDAVRGNAPRIVHVSGDVYAIAFEGPDSDGWLVTVSIDAAGAISDAVIDSLEFDETNGLAPDIIKIADDVVAIVYAGETNHGYVVTVGIDAAGLIGNAVIDSFEYNPLGGQVPSIIHVFGDVFAITMATGGANSFVITVSINTAGAIAKAVIDSYAPSVAISGTPKIAHVKGNVFAVALYDAALDGWIKTITVENDGTVGAAIIDTLEFDVSEGMFADVINIAEGVLAIAYRGPGTDGYIVTVGIDAAGLIGDTVIDSWEFNPITGTYPRIIHVSGNVFAIAHMGALNNGWLITLTIADDGTITKSWIDSLEFDAADCTYPSIVHVGGNIYAIAYAGTGSVGKLVTTGIETIPEGKIHHMMIMGMD